MFFNGSTKNSDLGLKNNVGIKYIVMRLRGNLIKLVFFLQLRILWRNLNLL